MWIKSLDSFHLFMYKQYRKDVVSVDFSGLLQGSEGYMIRTICGWPPTPFSTTRFYLPGYPESYIVKETVRQLEILRVHFPRMDLRISPLVFSRSLLCIAPREGLFVVLSWKAFSTDYADACKIVLAALERSRACIGGFQDNSHGPISSETLRLCPRTEMALAAISESQHNSEALLIGAQLGKRYYGKCVQAARLHFKGNLSEFELDPFSAACILITHTDRFVSPNNLGFYCAGAEYALKARAGFFYSLGFKMSYERTRGSYLSLFSQATGQADGHFGSATGCVI